MRGIVAALLLFVAPAIAAQEHRIELEGGGAVLITKGAKHQRVRDGERVIEAWVTAATVQDSQGVVVSRAPILVSGCRPNELGLLGQMLVVGSASPKPSIWKKGGSAIIDLMAEAVCATAENAS